MNKPKVSIIMATYNRAHFLPKAISSVLDQSFKNWELIILDDASTDNTETIVSPFVRNESRIKYIKQTRNLGVSGNRNVGISQAFGEYIAVLDSDDFWQDADKLKKQIQVLDNNKDIGIVGSYILKKNLEKEGGTKKIIFKIDDNEIRKEILCRNQFAHSSVMYRKALVGDGYNVNLELAEDYDLWLRIGLNSNFSNIPEYTTVYLVGSNSESNKKLEMARSIRQIIKKYKYNYPNYYVALVKAEIRILLALI